MEISFVECEWTSIWQNLFVANLWTTCVSQKAMSSKARARFRTTTTQPHLSMVFLLFIIDLTPGPSGASLSQPLTSDFHPLIDVFTVSSNREFPHSHFSLMVLNSIWCEGKELHKDFRNRKTDHVVSREKFKVSKWKRQKTRAPVSCIFLATQLAK